MPNGVSAPFGAVSVSVSPGRRKSCSANRLPMATPPDTSNPCSVPPGWIVLPIAGMRVMSFSRTPRTSTPPAPAWDEASACPSTMGNASLTPGMAFNWSASSAIVGQRLIDRTHEDVAVDPDDLVEKLAPESVHHGHDDDQRRNAQHDACEREACDDRDETFSTARLEVAQRYHPLEHRKGPGSGACGRLRIGA